MGDCVKQREMCNCDFGKETGEYLVGKKSGLDFFN